MEEPKLSLLPRKISFTFKVLTSIPRVQPSDDEMNSEFNQTLDSIDEGDEGEDGEVGLAEHHDSVDDIDGTTSSARSTTIGPSSQVHLNASNSTSEGQGADYFFPCARDLTSEIEEYLKSPHLRIPSASTTLPSYSSRDLMAELYAGAKKESFTLYKSHTSQDAAKLSFGRHQSRFQARVQELCPFYLKIEKVTDQLWGITASDLRHNHTLQLNDWSPSTLRPIPKAVTSVPGSRTVNSQETLKFIKVSAKSVKKKVRKLSKSGVLILPSVANQFSAATHEDYRTHYLAASLQRGLASYVGPFRTMTMFTIRCGRVVEVQPRVCLYQMRVSKQMIEGEYRWIALDETAHTGHLMSEPIIGRVDVEEWIQDDTVQDVRQGGVTRAKKVTLERKRNVELAGDGDDLDQQIVERSPDATRKVEHSINPSATKRQRHSSTPASIRTLSPLTSPCFDVNCITSTSASTVDSPNSSIEYDRRINKEIEESSAWPFVGSQPFTSYPTRTSSLEFSRQVEPSLAFPLNPNSGNFVPLRATILPPIDSNIRLNPLYDPIPPSFIDHLLPRTTSIGINLNSPLVEPIHPANPLYDSLQPFPFDNDSINRVFLKNRSVPSVETKERVVSFRPPSEITFMRFD